MANQVLHSLYCHHIPTSFLQKTILSVGAAAMAITQPARGDMVATLGETTGHYALKYMQGKMQADPVGRKILEERPRITTKTVDLSALRQKPVESFGRVYVDWLDANHCNPDDREPVHFIDDPELAYVMQRYRDTHDLFHALLGMPTTMLGEVVVKWVEALQLGLPMCVLAAAFGPVRLGPKHLQVYRDTHLAWAVRNGYHARFLMNIYFEKCWDMPVDELRSQNNIETPPDTPPKKQL